MTGGRTKFGAVEQSGNKLNSEGKVEQSEGKVEENEGSRTY